MSIYISRNVDFIMVYRTKYNVIEDYISSLKFVSKIIEFVEFINNWSLYVNNSKYIIIFTQMWFTPDTSYKSIKNLIFLNVEQLTEQNRMENIINIMNHGIPIADYSKTNFKKLEEYSFAKNININVPFYYLPYQYNSDENIHLYGNENAYEYDVGIINAIPSIDGNIENRRTKLWNDLQKTDLKILNIMGWKKERDEQISKCKIILNVHNFDLFKIFEHIRCDRLVFAQKLIVSELSLGADALDIFHNVIWVEYEQMIPKLQYILSNFEYFKKKFTNQNVSYIINNRRQQLQESIDKMLSV